MLAAVVVAGLAWWWPRWLPVLAFTGMAAAGLLTAIAAQPAASGGLFALAPVFFARRDLST